MDKRVTKPHDNNEKQITLNFLERFLIFTVVGLTVFSYDIFVPNLSMMRQYFNTTPQIMQMSITMMPFLGSFSGLIYGHYGDYHGRKPAMHYSLVFLAVGSFISALSVSIEWFMFGRILQAIGSGGLLNIAVTILGDVFSGVRYAKALSVLSLLFPVTYAFAPNIGAFLGKHYGWQSNFYFMGIAMVVYAIAFAYYIPETLHQKNKHVRLLTIVHKLQKFFKPNRFLLLSFIHSLPIALPITFVTYCSFLMVEEFNISPSYFAALQLFPIAVNILTNFAYQYCIEKIGFEKAYLFGKWVYKIFFVMTFSLSFLHYQNVFVLVFLNSFFFLGVSFIATTAVTEALDMYKQDKALRIAFVSMIRNLCMAFCLFISSLVYNKTAIPLYILSALVAGGVVILYSYERNMIKPSKK